MPRRIPPAAFATLAIAAFLATSACGGSTAGSSEASCAKAFDFKKDTYILRDIADYAELEMIGRATEHPCHDNSGPADAPDGTKYMVFEIRGADPDLAVAIGENAEDTDLYVVNGDPLPAGVQEAIGTD